MEAVTLILMWFFILMWIGCFARGTWRTRQYDNYITNRDRGRPWHLASLAFAAAAIATILIGPLP
jgi:DNA-binding transcriptional regulator of glucitol operon